MLDDERNKRLYRRVDVVIPFGFRPVERAMVDAALVPEPAPLAEASDDPILAALERIERKVDRVLERLEWDDRSPPMRSMSVNLSGAGVRFGSEWPLESGSCVDLALVLPGEPPMRMRAFGEVVRSRKVGRPSGGLFEIAVSFVTITARDRESIIRYTFQMTGR